MVALKNILNRTLDSAVENYKHGGVQIIGIPTGLTELDRLLGGFRPGEYYVIGGRTSSGKSSLGFNFALNACKHDYTVAYITLEMSEQVLSLRYLAAETGMSSNYIERGLFTAGELASLQTAALAAQNLDLHVYDKSLFVDDVETILNRHKEVGRPVDALFVDYISLFSDKGESFHERISDISRKLRQYSRDFEIPVITLAQLNRNVEHRDVKIPVLSDLAESGSLERDASAVIFVYRHHYYEMMFNRAPKVDIETDAQLIVAKNRHGPTASIDVSFTPKRMLWEDR